MASISTIFYIYILYLCPQCYCNCLCVTLIYLFKKHYFIADLRHLLVLFIYIAKVFVQGNQHSVNTYKVNTTLSYHGDANANESNRFLFLQWPPKRNYTPYTECAGLCCSWYYGKLAIVFNHWSSVWYIYDTRAHISFHCLVPVRHRVPGCPGSRWETYLLTR